LQEVVGVLFFAHYWFERFGDGAGAFGDGAAAFFVAGAGDAHG